MSDSCKEGGLAAWRKLVDDAVSFVDGVREVATKTKDVVTKYDDAAVADLVREWAEVPERLCIAFPENADIVDCIAKWGDLNKHDADQLNVKLRDVLKTGRRRLHQCIRAFGAPFVESSSVRVGQVIRSGHGRRKSGKRGGKKVPPQRDVTHATHSGLVLNVKPNVRPQVSSGGKFNTGVMDTCVGGTRGTWPRGRPQVLRFVLHKRNLDSASALDTVARFLGLPRNLLHVAGTKDKRGVTSQLVTAFKVDATRLLSVKHVLAERGIFVGNFGYVAETLSLGELWGNRFSVVLRNADTTISRKEWDDRLSKLKEYGFINFFGLQRFGTGLVRTHEYGGMFLKGDMMGAFQAHCVPCDPNLVKLVHEYCQLTADERKKQVEAFRMRAGLEDAASSLRDSDRWRMAWWLSGGSAEFSLDALRQSFEAKSGRTGDSWKKSVRIPSYDVNMLELLASRQAAAASNEVDPGSLLQSSDYADAIACLPRTLRTMYTHAWQSYVWNLAASARIRVAHMAAGQEGQSGSAWLAARVGDIVPANTARERGCEVATNLVDRSLDGRRRKGSKRDNNGSSDAAGGGVDYSYYSPEEAVRGQTDTSADAIRALSDEYRQAAKKGCDMACDEGVYIVTENDVANGTFTLHDVLMPIVGDRVLMPGEETAAGASIRDALSQTGVYMEDVKRYARPLNVSGRYRRLIRRVVDLDYSLGNDGGKPNMPVLESEVAYGHTAGGHDGKPQHVVGPTRPVVQLHFSLPASSYATMLVREVTNASTSALRQNSK